jgi:NCAIR mutase (PurE)-related protein
MKPEPELSELSLRIALAGLISDPEQLDAAVAKLRSSSPIVSISGYKSVREIEGVDLDLQRATRCGFPEVVYGEGKTATTIVQILRAQQAAGQDSLVTRVQPEQLSVLQSEFADLITNDIARTVRLQKDRGSDGGNSGHGPVFVVTAGSSDRPVAEEALETLKWMRVDCDLIQDVGVAGPHRLLRHVTRLQTAAVIVCVAGMEAALPSVLGGYVSCPVIGVPTSVGYGASLQGMTALLSMLTCCASNVVCVNIDAGFKGGYVAGLIASRVRA